MLEDIILMKFQNQIIQKTKNTSPEEDPFYPSVVNTAMNIDSPEDGSSESLDDIFDYLECKENCPVNYFEDILLNIPVDYFDMNEIIDLPESFENNFSAYLRQLM